MYVTIWIKSTLQISFWAASIKWPLNDHWSFEIRMFLSSFLRLYTSLRTQKLSLSKSKGWSSLMTTGVTLRWVFQNTRCITNQTYPSFIKSQTDRQFLLYMISSSALLTSLDLPKHLKIFRTLTLNFPYMQGSFLIS